MRKILLLATLFLTCISAIGQTQPDPSFGNNGIVRTYFPPTENISYNSCEQVIALSDGSFYLLIYNDQQYFVNHRFADGSIDKNFGVGGYSVPFSISVGRAAVAPDGKIILGGSGSSNGTNTDFIIIRINTDGTLDHSFSGDGKQTIDFSGNDLLADIKVQSDGKILAVGSFGEGSGFAITRLNDDGSLDRSFSDDGKQTTFLASGPGFPATAVALTIENDRRIIVAGRNQSNPTVIAYLPDGELDHSFGESGIAEFDFTYYPDGESINVLKNGKITIAETFYDGGTYLVLLQLNNNGTPENSSSDDGMRVTNISGNPYLKDLVIDQQGRAWIAGVTNISPALPMIERFRSDGLPDSSFSADGIVTIPAGMNGYSATASSLTVQADAKVLVGGTYSVGIGTEFFAARLNPDATPDNTLNGDGIVADYLNIGNTYFFASAIQPDGKIVCAGRARTEAYNWDLLVARFNPNGSIDSSFSHDGFVTIRFEPHRYTNFFDSEAHGIAITSNGKIVVVGTTSGATENFAVARLNPDGGMDSSFSEDGKLATDFFGGNDYAYAVAVQPDGKIVVGGSSSYSDSSNINTNYDFSLVRYNVDGSLDNSFSWDGKQTTEFFSPSDKISKIIIQPNGNILAIGSAGPRSVFYSTFGDFALARYLPNGYPDNSFGYDGAIRIDIQGYNDKASDAIRLADGSILVGGTTSEWLSTNTHFAVVKLHPNGFVDSLFGTNGRQIIPLGFVSETCNAMAMQSNGEIVLGGVVSNSTYEAQGDDIALMRLFPNGMLDNSLSFGGNHFLDLGSAEETIESVKIFNNHLYLVGSTAYYGRVGYVMAYKLDCSLTATIPDAFALPIGVEPNTVYKGYAPAEGVTLTAMANGKFPFTYLWNTGATTKYIRVSPNTATTYDVTITDASGCSQKISKTVNVVDVRCGNKNEKVLVCELEKGKWSKRKTVCVDPWMATLLLWKGSHLGTCPIDGLSSPNITSAIEEETNSFGLHASPNPTYDQFALDINLNQPAKAELIITDMQGRIVERRFVNSSSLIRAGADYPAGIYMAELRQGEQRQVIKLVKLSR